MQVHHLPTQYNAFIVEKKTTQVLPESFISFSAPPLSLPLLCSVVLCSIFIGANMEVAMGVAGWFATPVVERLIKFGIVRLKDHVGWQKAMKEKLKKLQVILPNIQAVVSYASSQTEISDQHLRKWLWQLRDAIDEADDVLDDFDYIKHEQQLTKNNKKKKVRSFISYSLKKGFGKRAFKTNLKRLEEVVNKLDQVSTGVGVFFDLLQNTKQEQEQQQLELYKSRETGPLPQNDIIGRGYEKEYVMQWLKSKPSNEEGQTTRYKNISLLSIVGRGGMGKTTLLQHVYEDIKKTKEFDLEMWVCVSNNFDENQVIADMLHFLTGKRPSSETFGPLQVSLESEVNSKKFVLVLDDIWGEEKHQDKSQWEKVLAPLASGSMGSKILITTRLESVASLMAKVIGKKSETLKLEGLEENECLQLLNAHAFAGVENPDKYKKLRFIAGKMVKKLSGSPLAAKIMGGVLNSSLDERHWNKVLNSDIENIMPILRLSYTFLPKHLQICFAFCGIFPQDHRFDKDDLVGMWIALGFIQPSNNQEETLEDIGGRYFDALVKKYFFDKFSIIDHVYFKMHDLLNKLAQSISKHECLRVKSDQELFSETPETIRHLFLETRNQELKNIRKFKNLRSLYLNYCKCNVDEITEIFNATRSIRFLYIYAPNLELIPQEIGYLRHLRYLNFYCCHNISKWPTSLCNLYHLQFLRLENSYTTGSTFPVEDMNKLSNLRCLKVPFALFPNIPEIGKLTSLQELDNFEVKNEPGYRIGELEQMNNLQNLSINSLENVQDAQEACHAKLLDKRNLMNLDLNWGVGNNPIEDGEKVLDNLRPPSHLQKLRIAYYKGARSAIWMNTVDFISNLEIIKLIGCPNWQILPPFRQFPFLKSLYLFWMPKVKQFDNKFHGNDEQCVFPSLEKLEIHDLQALEDLFDEEAATTADHYMFPCLTELRLLECPKLQELPYLPPKLNKLFMSNIGLKTLNYCTISKLENLDLLNCPNITNISLAGAIRTLTVINCPKLISREVDTTENRPLIVSCLTIDDPSIFLMEPLRSINSLQYLCITRNDELVSFPIEAERCFLKVSSSLRELKFEMLKSLQSLPSSLESLSSLKSLWVDHIPQLRELPKLPPSLVQLYLRALNNLDWLPSCLPSLSSLKRLSIRDVPRLQGLPDLPSSLEFLEIIECHPELMERYRRNTGSDWHKIAGIPKVVISTD